MPTLSPAKFDRLVGYRKAKAAERKAARKSASRPSSIPTPWALENRDKLVRKENAAETYLESLLTVCGFPYTREYAARVDGRDRFIDFVVDVDGKNVGLEVDGAHHFKAKKQAADRKRDRALLGAGEVHHIVRLSWARTKALSRLELRDIVLWAAAAPVSSITIQY